MSYCIYCGSAIADRWKFCSNCGKPVVLPAKESQIQISDDHLHETPQSKTAMKSPISNNHHSHPKHGRPWKLTIQYPDGKCTSTALFSWDDIAQGINSLVEGESYLILEQNDSDYDYWFIQSAVAETTRTGYQYIVDVGYYGADAPMLFERTEDSVTAVLSWFRSAFESEDVDLTYFEKQS